MHGRVKVRTTEEQREIAKREKAKKAVAFRETLTKVIEKRAAGIYDQEGLNFTWTLLNENPDVITLWNYRREIFLNMKNENDLEEYQKLLEKDLILTEQCLRVNPKSYGSWHHRIWILDNLPKPDWEKELKLCTKYLQLDERNFHCWDYRKAITERSFVPDSSEYEYTMEKIEANFSNYSAWHLRSKLLPRIFPDPDNRFPINESKHKEELELVENAAFTDPYDQSPWFYLRWLLGLKEPGIRFLHVENSDSEMTVITSKAVKLSIDNEARFGARINILINGESIEGTWTSLNNYPQSCLWMFKPVSKIQSGDSIGLLLEENGTERERLNIVSFENFTAGKAHFLPEFSSDLMETITNQLSSCEQLIELEPDSKWTLLTRIFLMTCIDIHKYEEKIKTGLIHLCDIDPLRKGYYQDLRSRLITEMKILQDVSAQSKPFSLAGEALSSLYHSQYLWNKEEIDLSNNQLSSESLPRLYPFINCKTLNLTGNNIRYLNDFPSLPKLETLTFDGNCIEDFSLDWLDRFPKLKKLSLRRNPVTEKLDLSSYRGSIEIDCSPS